MATSISERQADWHQRYSIEQQREELRAEYIRRNAVRLNREFWARKAKECSQ